MITTGELKKLAADGELTSDVVIRASQLVSKRRW